MVWRVVGKPVRKVVRRILRAAGGEGPPGGGRARGSPCFHGRRGKAACAEPPPGLVSAVGAWGADCAAMLAPVARAAEGT